MRAGAPYENTHLWEDIFRLTKFPQIGHSELSDAGGLYPPDTDNSAQVWFPTMLKVEPYIISTEKYSGIGSPDGMLAIAIFDIVKVEGSTGFQLRLHPDNVLLNVGSRPNHNQLTQGSRLPSLFGGGNMHVYEAGEIYCNSSRKTVGINPKTGHYFNQNSGFNREVINTTAHALNTLGYDTSEIKDGDAFWTWALDY